MWTGWQPKQTGERGSGCGCSRHAADFACGSVIGRAECSAVRLTSCNMSGIARAAWKNQDEMKRRARIAWKSAKSMQYAPAALICLGKSMQMSKSRRCCIDSRKESPRGTCPHPRLKNSPTFLSGIRRAIYKITSITAETTELISVTTKLIANDTSAAGFPRIRIL